MTTSAHIEALEYKLTSLLRSQNAATWGEEQEREAEAIGEDLKAAYTAASTPEFDRIVL